MKKSLKQAFAFLLTAVLLFGMQTFPRAAGAVSLSYDGDRVIEIYVDGMVGLRSFDLRTETDAGVTVKSFRKPSFTGFCADVGNRYYTGFNATNGMLSGMFANELGASDEWETAADDLGMQVPDGLVPDHFLLGSLLLDASSAAGTVYISGDFYLSDGKTNTAAGIPVNEGSGAGSSTGETSPGRSLLSGRRISHWISTE